MFREIMNKQVNGAARFAAHIQNHEPPVLDATGPSGFTYKLHKPSKFLMLFVAGNIPELASTKAVKAWTQDGIVKPTEAVSEEIDNASAIRAWVQVRDRLFDLSVDPKLVNGPTDVSRNEVNYEELPEGDFEYLVSWLKAGGDTSQAAANFPVGSQPRPLASASRRKVRAKAK